MEAEETQNAQIIFGDTLSRVADKSHAALRKIVNPAGIVVDGAVARRGQRIDREIAPLGVGLPVASELNLGVAAIGLDVLAQRGDLKRMLVDDDGNRAVLYSRRHRLEAGGRHTLYDFIRHRSGCNVDFRDRHVEQRVSHCPADDARLLAVAIEHRQQARQAASGKPGRAAQRSIGPSSRRWHYFVVPGTNLPFSRCAGT